MSKEAEFLKKKGLHEPINFGGYGGDKVAKLLDEYANEVSREVAIDFAEHILNEVTPGAELLNSYVGYGGMYDLWIKEQEEKK